jgi:hypothetical protein
MERFELIMQCHTDSGVVFPAILEIPALSEEQAVKNAMKHLNDHGTSFKPMKAAPPIPVRVADAICVKVSRISLIATAYDEKIKGLT